MEEKTNKKNKTRQYYMDECCRLKYRLKKLQETKQQSTGIIELKRQIENLKRNLKKKQKIIDDLRDIIDKEPKPQPVKLEKITDLKNEIQRLKLKESNISKFAIDNTKLSLENETLKEALKVITTKNKRLYNADKLEYILNTTDRHRLSFATVLYTFEYMFIFQKLFEMYVFDYIVDRQNPDNKTDYDTKALISVCKEWTSQIISNQIPHPTLNIVKFKKAFKLFVTPYLENKGA